MTEHEDRENTSTLGTFAVVPAPPPAQKPSRMRIEIHVEGLPTIFFLGWRSTHATIHIAAFRKPVNRALIEARATIGGSLRSAAAVLRPGDTFDRETGKKLALARLVEALVLAPQPCYMDDARDEAKLTAHRRKQVKALRSRLFLEIWRRTHKGKMPTRAGRTYSISSLLDHLRLHQNLASLWLPLAPGESRAWAKKYGKKDAQVSIDIETVRAGGLPIPQNQGQTASTVIIDEISKWPTPHEAPPSEKAPEAKKESRTCDVCGAVVMGRCEYCGAEAKA